MKRWHGYLSLTAANLLPTTPQRKKPQLQLTMHTYIEEQKAGAKTIAGVTISVLSLNTKTVVHNASNEKPTFQYYCFRS